jgi:hypothetical protein
MPRVRSNRTRHPDTKFLVVARAVNWLFGEFMRRSDALQPIAIGASMTHRSPTSNWRAEDVRLPVSFRALDVRRSRVSVNVTATR